jgi:hypothetical protein
LLVVVEAEVQAQQSVVLAAAALVGSVLEVVSL